MATSLLREVEPLARDRGLARLEAWTRDDPATRAWYESRGFRHVQSYLNVVIDFDEGVRDLFPVTADGLRPGLRTRLGDPERMRERFRRVYENVLYELPLV